MSGSPASLDMSFLRLYTCLATRLLSLLMKRTSVHVDPDPPQPSKQLSLLRCAPYFLMLLQLFHVFPVFTLRHFNLLAERMRPRNLYTHARR